MQSTLQSSCLHTNLWVHYFLVSFQLHNGVDVTRICVERIMKIMRKLLC